MRASGSIPGVLPPFFTKQGEMLVDGALMDSVPLAPMKALKQGPNVIVAVGVEKRRKYPVDYDTIPGPAALLASMFNPFGRRRLAHIPNVIQVVMHSMLVHCQPELPLSNTDVLIQPESRRPSALQLGPARRYSLVRLPRRGRADQQPTGRRGPWISGRDRARAVALLSICLFLSGPA